jgi:hypothetical protein
MTADERHAVLSALIDREDVDPDALAVALEEPAGRALLVDFVRLRGELQREDAPAAEGQPSHALPVSRSHARMWRLVATLLLPLGIGVASGWWIGDWSRHERPPVPDRVLSFTRGVDWNKQ